MGEVMEEKTQVQLATVVIPVQVAVDELYEKLRASFITNDEELEEAVSNLSKLKEYRKHLEESRDALVRPLNDHVKFINGKFKETTNSIDKIEMAIKTMMSTYRRKREEEAEEVRKRIAEAAASQNIMEFTNAVAELEEVKQETTVVTSTGAKVTFRKIWTWELLEFVILPDFYKMIDEKVVNQAVRDGERDIPGIRIFQEENAAIGK